MCLVLVAEQKSVCIDKAHFNPTKGFLHSIGAKTKIDKMVGATSTKKNAQFSNTNCDFGGEKAHTAEKCFPNSNAVSCRFLDKSEMAYRANVGNDDEKKTKKISFGGHAYILHSNQNLDSCSYFSKFYNSRDATASHSSKTDFLAGFLETQICHVKSHRTQFGILELL